MTQYEAAKKRYAERGVDADAAINTLKSVPVSLHCWQGDDVRGFDGDPECPADGRHSDDGATTPAVRARRRS